VKWKGHCAQRTFQPRAMFSLQIHVICHAIEPRILWLKESSCSPELWHVLYVTILMAFSASTRARARTHTHTHTQPRSKLILIPLYTLQLNVIMHLDDLTQKNAKEQNIISEYMHSLVVLALLRTVASRSPSYN